MEIGKAIRPKPGEIECGDDLVVIEHENMVTIVVADGLGHGPEAAKASRATTDFFRESDSGNLERLVEDCSRAISHTRGVALTVVRVDLKTGRMEFVGVGNVEFKCKTNGHLRAVNSPGIVGRRIRRILPSEHDLEPGDLIVLFSDGISSRFVLEDYSSMPAQQMADKILEEHGKEHDDATCVTIKY